MTESKQQETEAGTPRPRAKARADAVSGGEAVKTPRAKKVGADGGGEAVKATRRKSPAPATAKAETDEGGEAVKIPRRKSPVPAKAKAETDESGEVVKTPRRKSPAPAKANAPANTAGNAGAKPRKKPAAGSKPAVKPAPRIPEARVWLRLGVEGFGLAGSALVLTMLAAAFLMRRFGGTDFLHNVLPFALAWVGWTLAAAAGWMCWRWLRRHLARLAPATPAYAAFGLLALCLLVAAQPRQRQLLEHLRLLVGGKELAARRNLEHQIFAAYRRYDQADLQKIIDRAAVFSPAITDAAASNDLDLDILLGVAATESSFLPRPSKDGGQGLFQITAVPNFIFEQARRQLKTDTLILTDSRHNAFVAAVTLKYYLHQMRDDLFLGLLAYNIGPRNGGLQFIMQQYGARDFVDMQPYLQQLPRDYPVRVLSNALAFRIWRREGRLIAYQDEGNAARIQALGIPGLLPLF